MPFALVTAVALGVLNLVFALVFRPRTSTPSVDPGDVDVPSTDEGEVIPVVFGEVRIKRVFVTWDGGFRVEPIVQKGGKK